MRECHGLLYGALLVPAAPAALPRKSRRVSKKIRGRISRFRGTFLKFLGTFQVPLRRVPNVCPACRCSRVGNANIADYVTENKGGIGAREGMDMKTFRESTYGRRIKIILNTYL